MQFFKRILGSTVGSFSLAAVGWQSVSTQSYPSRSVRLVVPFAAGALPTS